MRIASANLRMESTHTASQRHEINESLRMWVGGERPAFEGRGRSETAAPKVQLSDAGKAAQETKVHGADKGRDPTADDPKVQLIKLMLEFLTGREIKIFDTRELTDGQQPTEVPDPGQEAPRTAGYGVEYDRRESYSESARTTFSADGTVRTADGREIQFKIGLVMERSYHEESQTSLRLGDAVRKKDPLVLNFSGTAAQLTDIRFQFDLDADGQTDLINFVGAGSGFLVLDRNGDGKANNESELFGPTTGNGFGELAAFDDDHNGWIDENDGIYRELRVWTKDANGNDRLRSLADAQVGAISLTAANTPFDIKDNANGMLGQMRSSGVFLHEDGKAGTIHQIDLTI